MLMFTQKVMLSLCLLSSCRLFDTSEEQVEQKEEEKLEDDSPQPASQSYAATVALPSTPPSSTTLMGTVPEDENDKIKQPSKNSALTLIYDRCDAYRQGKKYL